MRSIVSRCIAIAVIALWAGAASAADPFEGGKQGPPAPDARVESLISRLQGTFEIETLTLHISPLETAGLPPSVYVEITRYGNELRPMVRQVWSVYVSGDKPRVRVSEFAPGSPYAQVFLAQWASPENFPRLDGARVDQVGDLDVAEGGEGVALTSPQKFAANRDGAWDVQCDMRLGKDVFNWRFTGFDQQDRPVWGEDALAFKRVEQKVHAVVSADGLVKIDLRTGVGHKVADADSIALNYNGYTMDGRLFSSTNVPGQKMFQGTLPTEYIQGFNLGVLGMAAPGVRRIIVPPSLCLGPGGQTGLVPPNAYLIYDIDLISVKNNGADDAPAPGGGAGK